MSDDIRFEAGQGIYVIGIDSAAINGEFSKAWSIAVSRSSYVLWDGEAIDPPRPDVPIATEKPKSGLAWYHAIDSRKREYRHLRKRRR